MQDKVYATTEIFGALVAMTCEKSPDFHKKFAQNPRRVLNKCMDNQPASITVEDSLHIVVHENDADTLHVAVPAYKSAGSMALSDDQLEKIAAGEVLVGALAATLASFATAGTIVSTLAVGSAVTASIGSGTAIALGAVTVGAIGAATVAAGTLATGALAGAVIGGLAASGRL